MLAIHNNTQFTLNLHNQHFYGRDNDCHTSPYLALYNNHKYIATVIRCDFVQWMRDFADKYHYNRITIDVYPRKSDKRRVRRWFATFHGCHLLDCSTGEILYDVNFDTGTENISAEYKDNLYRWRKKAERYRPYYMSACYKEDK